MVHIASALDFGAAPFAFRRTDVDEVDQRPSGAELQHAIFGQLPIDRAAQDLLIKLLSLGHVAHQQHDMVDTFEREGRMAHCSSLRLLRPMKKGGSVAEPTLSHLCIIARAG
jgi:hypothetical protein